MRAPVLGWGTVWVPRWRVGTRCHPGQAGGTQGDEEQLLTRHILLLPLGGNPPPRPPLIQLQLIGNGTISFNLLGQGAAPRPSCSAVPWGHKWPDSLH